MKSLVALALVGLSAGAVFAAGATRVKQQFLSPVYTIDKKYRSMEGPWSQDRVYLGDPKKPELLWITGVRTEMVGEDGKTRQLPEFMCHVNVDIDPAQHEALFGLQHINSTRLITLSQGMTEAHVPNGFGFPISSTEPLVVVTQVLNHNIEHPNNMKVRHRVTFEYVRDADVTGTPMKALFNLGISGMVPVDDRATTALPSMGGMAMPANGGPSSENGGDHGPSCTLGPTSRAPNGGMASDYVEPSGRKLTGHWVVPPGRQVTRSDVTWFLALPFDTTLHYAAVHLHPFAKSMALRDTTTGQLLFDAKATGPKTGIGLTHVDTFSSDQGIRLYKDHKYEVEAVYDNTTSENADSMASIYMGLADTRFMKPDAAAFAHRAFDVMDEGKDVVAVVRTTLGDFGFIMLPGRAAAMKQFLRLTRSGAFDHALVATIGPAAVKLKTRPLTADQSALVSGPLEITSRLSAGAIAFCPGETAFTIAIGTSAEADAKCTAFGRVVSGADVLRAMGSTKTDAGGAPATPIEITAVEIHDQGDSVTLAAARLP